MMCAPWTLTMSSPSRSEPARVGQGVELVAVAQQGRQQGQGDQHAHEGVPVGELCDGAGGQECHRGSPGPALAALEAVGEEEQQNAGAEGQGGRERAERAGQDFGDGVHAAVPEAGEDARGDVQDAHQGAGSGDEGGDGLGAWPAQYPAHPARTDRAAAATRNLARHFLICLDRHRIL